MTQSSSPPESPIDKSRELRAPRIMTSARRHFLGGQNSEESVFLDLLTLVLLDDTLEIMWTNRA